MLYKYQRLQFANIAEFFVFLLLLFIFNSGLAQPCATNILNADFDFQQNCNSKTIQFTNTSVINNGSITSYNWNFGDGNISAINNPLHTYLNYGTYFVSLSLIHSSGCVSVITDSVEVIASPSANFSFNYDSVCPDQLISFTNLSSGSGLTYKWYFRDGPNLNAISNTAINPSHYFYAAIGTGYQTFNIKLETKDIYGCIDSISKDLIVKQQPFIDFSENGNFRRCENVIGSISDTAIIYNYSNLSDILSCQINWGDGGGLIPVTSTFNNTVPLTHVYNSINNFPIQIKATGINGCVNTFKDTFEIISIPLPEFTSLTFSAGCVPFNVYTINNSTGITSNTITYINWGDNTIDTLAVGSLAGDTLYHTYTSTTCINNSQQPYNIVLTTKNECGAPFKSYGPVEVYAPPQSNVNIAVDSVCVGNPVVFQNQSIPNFCAANPRTIYTWNFGDSTSASVLAPLNNPKPGISHIYNQAGVYNVSLTAENTSPASTGKPGCGSTIDSVKVYIFETYADFGFNRVCFGDTTRFTNLSITPGGTINSLSWNFGDGTTSSQLNPEHIYQSPGKFIVKLSIVSSLGCEDFKYDTIIVDSLPKANFSYSNTCFGDSTYFTNQSFANSDSINSVLWDFGDGNISSLENPVHLYQDTGLYIVTLSVYNNNNCKNDTSIYVKVFANPIASFYTDTICAAYQRIFTNNSSGVDGNIIAYQWNMGDGIGSCNQIDTTYIYSGSGTYPVFLKITDINSCTDDTTINIYLGPVPQANFSFDTVCFGTPTHFSSTSNDNGVPIATYSWSFGDGNNATIPNPNHTFANLLNYNVTLKVSNVNSCIDSVTKNITLYSLPVADFSNTTVCQGDTSTFTQLSTSAASNIIGWNWNFGDANSDTSINPLHLYQNAGNYIVNLIVTDENTCSNDSSKTVIVRELPQPAFTVAHPCIGQASSFNIAATVPTYTNQIWYLGVNNDSSILANPDYTYNQSGNYNVVLSVTDIFACKGDTTQTIFIRPLPLVNFSFDTVCYGDSTRFIDLSIDSTTNISNWYWNFGDFSYSNDTNAIHTYNNSGLYTANLKVTNSYGCFDSISKQIIVDSIPYVNFSSHNVCLGNTNYFNDLSVSNGANINNWQWNFGDGHTDTVQNPAYIYSNPGFYNVSLNVTKTTGCINDTTISVLVHKLPIPDFSLNSVCVNNSLTFYANDTATSAINWQWNFGDGFSDSLQNPNHTYSNSGNYNVYLHVIDSNFCEADTTKNIYISPLPIAEFSFDTSCLGNAIVFTSSSTDSSGVISNWKWSFGDSTYSVISNPNHFYTQSGNYNVSLIISNLYGCSDSVQHTVLVDSLPVAAFSANNVTIGGTNIFTDNSIANSANLQSWQWDFGDGNTSNLQNPQHTYSQADTFNVSLIVVNSNGCEDTVIQNVIVFPLPEPDYTITAACAGDSSYFYDNSSSIGGNIISWKWYFGDGDSSSSQNPVHKYSNSGSYLAWLIVKDINGSIDSVSHTAIVNSIPIANYVFDTVCYGVANTFVDNSLSVTGMISQWHWDFGNGQTSVLQNPQHMFVTTNNISHFPVTLKVTDTLGCIDSITKQITVYPPVNAEFLSDTLCNNMNVQLTDISQSAAGSIVSWEWDFGNGSGTSNLQFPNFAYTNIVNNTVYNVKLIVSDTLGCKDSVYHQLFVHPQPMVNFNADASCLGVNTNFTDSTYSNGGSLSSWNWNFQGLGTSTAQNPVFLFPSWGVYNTTLTVTDVNGCTASNTYPVKVDSIPEVNFTYHGNCASGLINFTDISIPHGTPNLSWYWNFGDSYSSSLQNPVHFYTTVDTFNVTLSVGNSNGCFGTYSKQVYVNSSMTYEFSADTVCLGLPTHFVDSFLITNSQITTWLWNFGDGSTAAIHNPQHIYNNPGIYNVSLTVVDTAACVETINHNIKVNAKPNVDFTSDFACLGDSTHFTNISFSSSGISNSYWNFGDGGNSVISNPVHLYNNAGIFTTKLIAENNNGCVDSVEKSVNIINRPMAGFNVSNVCNGFPVVITDTSSNLFSFINSWNWNFGDGDSLFVANPGLYTSTIAHTYANPGNYSINLLISNNVCSDTAIRNIEVYPNPVAAFSVPDNCLNQNTLFTDTSVVSNYPVVSRLWSFGDGGNSNLQHPAHLYLNQGNYTAALSVTDSRGCVGYTTKNLNIFPLPLANFTSSQTCFHDSTQFTDLSFGNGGNIINRIWNFGDLTAASSFINPKHYYAAPKNYSVSLIVKNSNQCIDTVIHTITVDSLPQANFTNTTVCQGNQTIFTNTSVNHGSINNSWSWNFGDNTGVSVLQNPFYTYQNHGVFNAILLVTNQMGCKDSISKAVQVDTIPIANFKADSACLGLPTHFTNLSQSFANLNMTYLWNFGDNTPTSTLANPTHIYANAGNYMVSLTVTDAHGCSKSVVKNIVVYSLPVAGFTAAPTQFPAATSFVNTTIPVTNTTINSWNWNFGNAIGTSNIQNPVYTYPTADTFNVRLIVADNHGCKDTVINPVIVYLPFIHADFGFTTVCQNSNTLFSDSTQIGSGNGILSWNWNFGDNSFSNMQNPIHQYVNPGTYQVQLKVTGIGGIKDSITKTVTVYPKPHADFDNTGVCIGVNKTFTSLSSVITGNIISWNWNFGNGNTANTLNHNTVYNNLGNYPVLLIVRTDNGCIDSITKITKVNPLPIISFSSDISGACAPIFVNFKDSSSVDSGFITNWIWDFGDGSSANTSVNITSHSYNTAGNYNVSVTAYSNNTCNNTLTIPSMISVYPDPVADFEVNPKQTSVLDSKIQFTDLSGGVSYWNWYFGDSDSSHVQHPSHTYLLAGEYYPLLLVTSAQGCKDTITRRVVILKDATFYAPSAFTPNNDGYNDVFQVYGIDLGKGKFEMMIFSRWGDLVFHSEDYNYGWNGSMSGNKEACPDGVYAWKIRYTDALGQYQTAYGHVTLIR